jgi:hypothetical protein
MTPSYSFLESIIDLRLSSSETELNQRLLPPAEIAMFYFCGLSALALLLIKSDPSVLYILCEASYES